MGDKLVRLSNFVIDTSIFVVLIFIFMEVVPRQVGIDNIKGIDIDLLSVLFYFRIFWWANDWEKDHKIKSYEFGSW